MVNIKDIEEFEKIPEMEDKNILKQIFDKQRELIAKYRKIENLPIKVDINLPEHQKLLKEITFRGIEELAEAQEAINKNDYEHFVEEISDSLHFFTEILLMVDIDYKKIKNFDNIESKKINLLKLKENLWDISYYFSISCNKLKLKPWKQTQILADVDNYKKSLIEAYNFFIETLIKKIGFSSKQILEIYMKKNLVNKFRIRSKY